MIFSTIIGIHVYMCAYKFSNARHLIYRTETDFVGFNDFVCFLLIKLLYDKKGNLPILEIFRGEIDGLGWPCSVAPFLLEVLRLQTRPHYFSLSKHKVPGAGTFIESILSLGARTEKGL